MEDAAAVTGTLVGVCVAYCENGKVTNQWINISAVGAIAWDNKKIDERGAGPKYGATKIPPGKEPTDSDCPKTMGAGGAPVCWWNGSAWVCGEA